MKKYIETESENKIEEHGFTPLIGENITVFCCRYIYHGKLIEEGNDYIKLKNPSIVYETGAFSDKQFSDIQSLNVETWNIAKQSIEGFGVLDKE